MATYSGTITFNSIELDITGMSVTKEVKTQKQVIGKSFVEVKIVGNNSNQWRLKVTGKVIADATYTLGVKRAQIEALDDSASHAYVDGIHDGTYYVVPGSIDFRDSGETGGMSYNYTMELVEA